MSYWFNWSYDVRSSMQVSSDIKIEEQLPHLAQARKEKTMPFFFLV